MSLVARLRLLHFSLLSGWRNRGVGLKAVSFALVGLVNTAVDFCVFLAVQAAFARAPATLALFDEAAATCRCAGAATVSLVAANIVSWLVAVSGSYVLNSSITFAAESGRQLRWRAYLAFFSSGIFGGLANTAMLIFAAQSLLLPVWLAKALAILASFVVNFLLSHFIVFRVRHRKPIDIARDA
jgi:putative flippase GtrA